MTRVAELLGKGIGYTYLGLETTMMGLKKFQIGKLRFRKVNGRWVWLFNGKRLKFGSDSSGR